ncbi:Putative acyl-CoA thioesterase, HotDog domain superfamily [Septoria linicola]|uniref:Acyl-CoA thioesterase, HotDog domain superfamily n=1 Tax=Septoria linicola TaxID=215465 RepID=A0A9Q9ASQ8_9PEZI|nr:Putative acyl-CoA thioesterase, HotDog domain superfamily [Septoria linicola]
MAELYRQHDFERSLAVKPTEGQPDSFTSVYGPWGYTSLTRIAGSIPLAEATTAAYKTVPAGFELHCLQSHFLRPGVIGVPLQYDVQRLMTSGNFASRHVLAKQGEGDKAEIKAVGFPPEHEYTILPSEDTIKAAAQPIDPESDEFNGTLVRFNLPEGTPCPPFSSTRLHVSQEPDINSRKHRIKLRVKSPLSGTSGQILAVIYLSDTFVVDAPLVVKDIDFGVPKIGDKSRALPQSQLKQFTSLTHNLRFARLEGWDVHEGILREVSTRWVKDRRGVTSIIMRDCKGELIATGEQEGYYVFRTAEEMMEGGDWKARSGGRAASAKI